MNKQLFAQRKINEHKLEGNLRICGNLVNHCGNQQMKDDLKLALKAVENRILYFVFTLIGNQELRMANHLGTYFLQLLAATYYLTLHLSNP